MKKFFFVVFLQLFFSTIVNANLLRSSLNDGVFSNILIPGDQDPESKFLHERFQQALMDEGRLLRSFVVEPKKDGNKFEQAAERIARCTMLSHENYQKYGAISDSLLGSSQALSVYREALIRDLKSNAIIDKDSDFRIDPYKASGFIAISRVLGVVLKFSNPFVYDISKESRFNFWNFGISGLGRRQVRRVLTASELNKKLAETGVCAPQKFLCMRPGSTVSGSVADSHCVVIAEYMDEPSIHSLGSEYNLSSLTDSQILSLFKAMSICNFDDLSPENVVYKKGNFYILDTEPPHGPLSMHAEKVCNSLLGLLWPSHRSVDEVEHIELFNRLQLLFASLWPLR